MMLVMLRWYRRGGLLRAAALVATAAALAVGVLYATSLRPDNGSAAPSRLVRQNGSVACTPAVSSATLPSEPTNGPYGAPRVSPFAALTEAQQQALMEKQTQEWNTRYGEWIAALDTATIDLRALPVMPSSADPIDTPPATLAAAVSGADTIVDGTVVSIKPTADFVTIAEIDVITSLKGSASATQPVTLGWYLQPTLDWSGEFVVQAPGQPLVFPSDHVILFLHRDVPGAVSAEGYTGLAVVNGQVANPWDGGACEPESAFEQQIGAAASAQ